METYPEDDYDSEDMDPDPQGLASTTLGFHHDCDNPQCFVCFQGATD